MKDIVEIKKFDINDQDRARRLILEGLGEHFGYIDETCNPDIDDIDRIYIKSGNLFIVACLNCELVGTGGLIGETKETGRLVRMSVDKSYRKKGIGRKIVEYLIVEARKRGYKRAVLSTEVDWIPAIALYESCGFKEYGRNEVDLHMYRDL